MHRIPLFVGLCASVLCAPLPANAQKEPFKIADNSFLVEEAFNQETGVFQNIFLFQRAKDNGGWAVEFTQEWPVWGQRHQFSYTLPYDFRDGALGNILLNYRLQSRMEDESGPAISPRVSLILPTGDDLLEYGAQLNLPISKQFGDAYVHLNLGATLEKQDFTLRDVNLFTPHFAGSVIYRIAPLFHLMVESVASSDHMVPGACCTTDRAQTWIVSPGARGAINIGDHQLALGGAVPLVISQSKSAPYGTELVLYLSYELPFKK